MTGYTTPKGVGSLVQADESTRKAHLLLAATELFVASDAPSRVERHVYGELFRQYITVTPVAERRKVATLLSRCDFAPHDCVLALAQDEDASVAHRVLAYSTVLSDCDLIAAVGRGPQAVRRAISLRRSLSDDVLSALGRYISEDADFFALDDENELGPVLAGMDLDIARPYERLTRGERASAVWSDEASTLADMTRPADAAEMTAAPDFPEPVEAHEASEPGDGVDMAATSDMFAPPHNPADEAAEPVDGAQLKGGEVPGDAEPVADISDDTTFAGLPSKADDALAALRALARKMPLPEQPPVSWSEAGVMAAREKRSDFEFVGEDESRDEAAALAESVEAMNEVGDAVIAVESADRADRAGGVEQEATAEAFEETPETSEKLETPETVLASASDPSEDLAEEALSEDARAQELARELADGLANQLCDVSLGLRIEADLEPMEQLRQCIETTPARAAFGLRRTPPSKREDAPGAIPLTQRVSAIRKLNLSFRRNGDAAPDASVATSDRAREPVLEARPERGIPGNPIIAAPLPAPVAAPAERAVPEGATLAPREARLSPTPGFNADDAKPVVTSPTRPRVDMPKASAELKAFLDATPRKRRRFIIKAQAEVLAETVARRGRLRDKVDADLVACVEKTAAANDMETLRGLLSYAFNLPPQMIERLLADPHGEPLMIMAAAIGVPTSRTVNMALLISPAAYSLERVRELSALRANLDIRVARHMVAAWTQQPAPKPVHAPILDDAMRTRRQSISTKANPAAEASRENTLDDDGVLVLRKVV
ncbi:DUF2336 domain-containing protein [Breoghania sp.]|uniref:DUF2336 domain-containing protein n=1 Tax=Breoghania sp. TaxID=2065378 RepID=UPI002AAAB41A|nr:DUF2336 domain-containing protein [Breoghania sp.]